jgi:hypothetical protein
VFRSEESWGASRPGQLPGTRSNQPRVTVSNYTLSDRRITVVITPPRDANQVLELRMTCHDNLNSEDEIPIR